MRITICGAGNAAHTLIPLLAGGNRHTVIVYAPLEDEATRLLAAISEGGIMRQMTGKFPGGLQRAGTPQHVTADPSLAAAGAELVLLALPSFAHESILLSLAPYLPADAWIGALPARGGFDWLVRELLPHHRGPIFGLQTLPWACRIERWGHSVEVLGAKAQVDLAAKPADLAVHVAATVAALIEIPLRPVATFLALTLANTGQIIHPAIMYGLFHAWDGRPFGQDRIPLFYGDVDNATAGLMHAMSNEIQLICRALEQALPNLDLRTVSPVFDWLLRSYPQQIADASTLRSAFNTNSAYAGLRAPVEAAHSATKAVGDNRYVPAFSSRYLSEDVPFSLLVSKGIAEIAGVDTSAINRVICWAQERLNGEYVVDDRVAGKDVAQSRAPQRFGICSLDALSLL